MSCFIVSSENIRQQTKLISTLLNSKQLAESLYGLYGAPESIQKAFKHCLKGVMYDDHMIYRTLYIMNLRAFNGRYKDGVKEFEKYRPTQKAINKVQLFKSIQCYIYQCSEDPVYKSDLFNAIVDLKNCLASAIVQNMPEYDTAEWD